MNKSALTPDEILTELARIIEEITEIPAVEVTPDKHFINDLDIDSLCLVEVLAMSEAAFDIDVKDDEREKLNTVGDVITEIQKIQA
ncbi:acyl carrier protein [Streptomyces sp. NBC_00470]|uniref:acyl carrier protein n=1 Tax=Streptomyces sp. NBC_00470 TaxID=2975753 RepID=UPI002F9093AB